MTYQLVLSPDTVTDFVTQADRRMAEMKGHFPIIEKAADASEVA